MAKKDFDVLAKVLKKIPRYIIEIGVFSEDTGRTSTVKVGVTNAELMFIHEEGSPIRHLHGYKVLEKTITYANKNLLDKAMSKAVMQYVTTRRLEDLERPLKRMCMRMENYARRLIYDNNVLQKEKMNSYETAKRKWLKEPGNKGKTYPGLPAGSHPLFDTGQLARSITCRLKRV